MYDAVLRELIMNKLPQHVQLSLVAILERLFLQFAAAADVEMQRLSMSASIHSVGCCHLQSTSVSSAKAEIGPSNALNFKTLLDRIFFF